MDTINPYVTCVNTQLVEAQRSRQRRLVVLSGEKRWVRALVNAFCQQYSPDYALWVSDSAPKGCKSINNTQAKQFLGTEIDCLIYDVFCGFDPNAIAALSGALVGGGLLILMVPPFELWDKRVDPDYQRLLVYPFKLQQLSQRFMQLVKDSLLRAPLSLLIEQDKPAQFIGRDILLLAKSQALNTEEHRQISAPNGCTWEQQQAVDAIVKVCTGRRRRPLVMTSDRGRGKSSALGIACALLLKQSERSIVVTAPRRGAVQPVFIHAGQQLGVTACHSNRLLYRQSSISFVAPDELLRSTVTTDLLLVDEAAAIPAAMLERMLRRYSRIVFSTTEHGYEGCGRGFAIRFKRSLNQLTPQWKGIQLDEPVRWASGDPVEYWLFDALLLKNQHVNTIEAGAVDLNQCVVQRLDRDTLLNDRNTLQSLFTLLVNAHYQTSPADLRNLLDGPTISVWVTKYHNHVIAAALVAQEGCFDEAMAVNIGEGKRRPQGHLLPQTLAVHGGWLDALALSYLRVMRIAVEPTLQRLGLGKQLLQAIMKQARADNIDAIGSSFAATADVITFWCHIQCVPVRVGISVDACSGVPSAVVLCALSTSAQQLVIQARERFIEQLQYGLGSIYRELSPELVAQLLSGSVSKEQQVILTHQDWLEIHAFADGYRQYELCGLALHRFTCVVLGRLDILKMVTAFQRCLLIKCVLQHHKTKTVANSLSLSGKKQLIMVLRDTIKILSKLLLNSELASNNTNTLEKY